MVISGYVGGMRIAVTSTGDLALNSLYDWFTMDDDVVRTADVSMGASGTRPGSQSPLDYIDVIVSNATAIANLIIAYKTWRLATVPDRDTEVKFKIGEIEAVAKDADDETIERIIAALIDAQEQKKVEAKPPPEVDPQP